MTSPLRTLDDVVTTKILAPNLNPVLLAACRRVEEGTWWELLGGAIRQ